MAFSFYPAGSEVVYTPSGEQLDVSGCSDPVRAVRQLWQSTGREFPLQVVCGLSVGQVNRFTGKNIPGDSGVVTVPVWGDGVSWDPDDSGRLVVVLEHGDVHSGVSVVKLPSVSRGEYPITDPKFIAARNRMRGYRRKVTDHPDGTVTIHNDDGHPAGCTENMSKKHESGSRLESGVLSFIVESGYPVLVHEEGLGSSLGLKVTNFVYSNTKGGLMAGDVQESYYLVPDIVMAERRSDGRGLVVEIDGFGHLSNYDDDVNRTRALRAAGWEVIRLRLGGLIPVTANDVVCQSMSRPSARDLCALGDRISAFYDSAPAGEPTPPPATKGAVYTGGGTAPEKSGSDQDHDGSHHGNRTGIAAGQRPATTTPSLTTQDVRRPVKLIARSVSCVDDYRSIFTMVQDSEDSGEVVKESPKKNKRDGRGRFVKKNSTEDK